MGQNLVIVQKVKGPDAQVLFFFKQWGGINKSLLINLLILTVRKCEKAYSV
jgi:protein gp37